MPSLFEVQETNLPGRINVGLSGNFKRPAAPGSSHKRNEAIILKRCVRSIQLYPIEDAGNEAQHACKKRFSGLAPNAPSQVLAAQGLGCQRQRFGSEPISARFYGNIRSDLRFSG